MQIKTGELKTLTPGPWTTLRTKSKGYLADLIHALLYGPRPRTSMHGHLTGVLRKNENVNIYGIWVTEREGGCECFIYKITYKSFFKSTKNFRPCNTIQQFLNIFCTVSFAKCYTGRAQY